MALGNSIGYLRRFLCGAAAFWAVSSPACGDDAAALAVVQASQANLNGFTKFTCRYTFAKGIAASPADAVAGKYAKPPRVGTLTWARDGANQSLKVIEDEQTTKDLDNPRPLQPVPGKTNLAVGTPVPFISSGELTSENEHLIFTPRFQNVNMWGRGAIHTGFPTLFGCYRIDGCDDLLYKLREAIEKGRITCTVTKHRDGERELVKIHTRESQSGEKASETRDYFFDPDRGYLLVRFLRTPPPDSSVTAEQWEYPDPKACDGGLWFPGRVVACRKPKSGEWLVRDAKVVELTIGKPAREHFEIELPAGTSVLEFGRPKETTFWTRKPERIHVDDLPRLYQMTQEVGKEPLMDTAIVQPRSYRWAWWTGAGLVGLSLLGLVRRAVLRKRESPPTGA